MIKTTLSNQHIPSKNAKKLINIQNAIFLIRENPHGRAIAQCGA